MKKLRQTLGKKSTTNDAVGSGGSQIYSPSVEFSKFEDSYKFVEAQRETLSNVTDKCSKRTQSASALVEKGTQFFEALTIFSEKLRSNLETQQLGTCFLKLTMALRIYESLNNDINELIISHFLNPMQGFLKKEIPLCKEQRKKFEKKQSTLESAEARLRVFDGRSKKDNQNDPKYFESEQEYNTAKFHYENTIKETKTIFSLFEKKYDYVLLDQITSFSDQFSNTLSRATTAISEVLSQLSTFKASVDQKKQIYSEVQEEFDSINTSAQSSSSIIWPSSSPSNSFGSLPSVGKKHQRAALPSSSLTSPQRQDYFDPLEDDEEMPEESSEEETSLRIQEYQQLGKEVHISPIVKEGWLWKKLYGQAKWRNFYFVLKYRNLLYFSSSHADENSFRGNILLSCCSLSKGTSGSNFHYFSINSSSSTNYISSKSENILEEWILAIKICLEEEENFPAITSEEQDIVKWTDELKRKTQDQEYEEKRKRLLEQLLISERGYVQTLNSLLQLQNNISTEKMLPKQYDEKIIFSNIHMIFEAHKELLSDLENIWKSHHLTTKQLAVIFQKRIGSFSLYGQYVANYSTIMYTLTQSMKHSRVNSHIRVFEQENGTDIVTSFSLPLNRNIKYEMFLESLIENCRTGDPGFVHATEAFEAMQDISEFIDQSHLQSTRMDQLFNIKQKISGCTEEIAVPGRRLIREGMLNRKGPSKEVSRYFFLFNDLFIEAKKGEILIGGGGLTFKGCLPILRGHVNDSSSEGDSNKNSFMVYLNSSTYHFSTSSPQEKDLWIRDFNRVFSSLNAKHVFGTALAEVMNIEQEKNLDVPFVVHSTTKHLRSVGLKTEGIFRLSGSHSIIEAYREQIDQGNTPSFEEEENIHNVTGVLKLWLRELPEPPIPWVQYSAFVETSKLERREEICEGLKKNFMKLPNHNRNLLLHLLSFLREVYANSEFNKMSLKNIAIVFGPIILSKKKSRDELINPGDFNEAHQVVTVMLTHYDEVFEEAERNRSERTDKGIRRPELQRVESYGLQKFDTFDQEHIPNVSPGRELIESGTQLSIESSEGDDDGDGDSNSLSESGKQTSLLSDFNNSYPNPPSPNSQSSSSSSSLTLVPGEIVKEGFLSREVMLGAYHRWKPTWFVLKYKVLLSYNSPKDAKPRARTELGSDCVIEDSHKKQFCFIIISKSDVISLCGKSQQEADEWKEAIRSCMERLS